MYSVYIPFEVLLLLFRTVVVSNLYQAVCNRILEQVCDAIFENKGSQLTVLDNL